LKSPDFIHSQKRDPHINPRADAMPGDFWSPAPEALHPVTILFPDRGLPKRLPFRNGCGSPTDSFIHAAHKRFQVKIQLKTQLGIRCRPQAEADALAGQNPDH
jgi:catalase